MAGSLRVILFPILSILRILGLNTFRTNSLQTSSLWKYYSILLMIYLVTQYFFNITALVRLITPRDSQFSMFISLMASSLTEMLAAFYSLFVTIRMSEKKRKIISKLLKIEDKLFLLNMGIGYSKFQWYSRTFIFSTTIIFFMISDFILMKTYDPKRLRTIMMLRYSARFISWYDVFYFMSILKIIRLHFERINEEILTLSKFRYDLGENHLLKIKQMYKIYKSLKNVCKIHNEVYGMQLVCLVYFFMCVTTTFIYFIINCNILYFILKIDLHLVVVYLFCGFWTLLYYVVSYFMIKSIIGVAEEVRN